ncbi:MAG: glutaredoxin domain-containing protein [Woeseiaceae bacterium]|nr:glutaredoxin domain-containing protein [Woeseiaceae bacterium]
MQKIVLILSAVVALLWLALVITEGSDRRVSQTNGPTPMLFVTKNCGHSCSRMRRSMSQRLDIEEHDAFDGDAGTALYKQYGGEGYLPYAVIGDQHITGNDPGSIISAIAIEYGPGQLPLEERDALRRHFDRYGEPITVMYATSWCGYCDRARDYFADRGVELVEFDIEHNREARRDYDILMGYGTPLIYQGYKRVQGFDVPRIEQTFDLD